MHKKAAVTSEKGRRSCVLRSADVFLCLNPITISGVSILPCLRIRVKSFIHTRTSCTVLKIEYVVNVRSEHDRFLSCSVVPGPLQEAH